MTRPIGANGRPPMVKVIERLCPRRLKAQAYAWRAGRMPGAVG